MMKAEHPERGCHQLEIEKQNVSLKDQVYHQIVEMICSGQLTPDTLFTERQAIEWCGVSKSPVRESLVQLCAEGALRSIPRCGYQVVQISAKNIRDLTEMRLFLELDSLPNVLKNLDEEKIRELRLVSEKRYAPDKDVWRAWDNNIRFHLTLNRYSGNVQIYKVLEQAYATCARAYAQLYTVQKAVIAPGREARETGHDLIVKALERHELYTAHEQLKKDILFMEEQLLITRIAR